MKFEIYIPSPVLRPFIKHLVISESDAKGTYKVLPGMSVVLGFQYQGKLSYLEGGRENQLSLSGVTGLLDHFRVFKNSPQIGSVLVVFQEGGAAAFFHPPVHELFNESLSMDTFLPPSALSEIEERLSEQQSDKQRIELVEQFMLKHVRPIAPDVLVEKAVSHIRATEGGIRIKHLADKLFVSQSPLEKRFRRVVGASPKKYASIVRLKSLLNSPLFFRNPLEAGLKAGYFDQAHFIKDFKTFTGQTPEQFRSSRENDSV